MFLSPFRKTLEMLKGKPRDQYCFVRVKQMLNQAPLLLSLHGRRITCSEDHAFFSALRAESIFLCLTKSKS